MPELLEYAKRAARESAPVIRSFYGTATIEIKEDNSPVTEADTAAHDIILKVLKETGIPILSEEDTEHLALPYPDRLWIIDPLDGTKGFIKHTDDFAVMIGLIEHGRPTLGVVHCPVGDRVYYALKGSGAFVEENAMTTKLQVSERTRPSLRALLSVNHPAPYMSDLCEKLEVKETVGIGSIGIKAGYIGEDRADFYVTLGALGEWDICAPEIILTEAGGRATDEHGDPLYYGNDDHRIKHGIVFSNSVCHEAVLAALKST